MIATVGEALVDLIEQSDGSFRASLGGSVCNFTLGLARQAVPTTYLSPLSNDDFGRQFHERLTKNGVVLTPASRSPLPTSLAIVHLDERGSPRYTFYRDSVADRDGGAQDLIAAFPDELEALHTGGLALMPADLPKLLTVIEAAERRGAVLSIDANLRPLATKDTDLYLTGVERVLRRAQIIKVSDEDADALGLHDVTAASVAEHFFSGDSSIRLCALTLGARGAALVTRSLSVELPAPRPQRIIDTVGAGDCFHAGLIASLARAGALRARAKLDDLDEDMLTTSLRHALAAATYDIMRPGCSPGSWEQIAALTAELLPTHPVP
jgi:fructokinase